MDLAAIIRSLSAQPEPEPEPRRWWQWWWVNPPKPEAPLEFTPADLMALIAWLPDDSATSASVSGGKHYRGWGHDRWLLKTILDATQMNGVIAMKIAAASKAGRIKTPEPWPDPERQLRLANQMKPKAQVAKLRSHFG